MKQEGDEDMTAQEEAWIAGRLFINDAQRSRFLAFRSGGRLGLMSILKQQSEDLFPGRPTPMSIDAANTARKIDSSILAVFKDSSDKQIEAMILDPAPEGTSTKEKAMPPTEVHWFHKTAPNLYGIYGICLRSSIGESLCLKDLMKVFKELEAYHAGLVLDPDRNVMIRPSQTPAEAQKFQKIDEQIGGCHYVETSLLRDSTRRYCTTQEHMTEYQDLARKWRETSTAVSAQISRAQDFRTKMSAPLFTDIGASKAVEDIAQQHSDGEMSRLMGLISAIAQTLNAYHDRFSARIYLLALLPDAKLVPMAEHVIALLVGAYMGHGGVKKYAPADLTNLAAEAIPRERRTRVRDDPRVKIQPEKDISIVTAYPEIHQRATGIISQINLKRKSLPEQEQITATVEEEKELWVEEVQELEKSLKVKASAARSAANAAEKRSKKLKVAADKMKQLSDKMEKLSEMALLPDEDVVEIKTDGEEDIEDVKIGAGSKRRRR